MSPSFFLLCIGAMSTLLGYVFSHIIVAFHSLFIAPLKRKKYLNLKEYKTVYAERVSGMPLPNPDDGFALTYKYTTDNKTYLKTFQSKYDDTFTTLYYLNDPKHTVNDINKLYCIEDESTITKIGMICGGIFFLLFLILKLTI